MKSRRLVATGPRRPRIVAVIASFADLRRALRLRRLPDFFELRLDALYAQADELLSIVPKLRAPLIITARHPEDGGFNELGLNQRRQLLSKFLPVASLIDIEARSFAELRELYAPARALGIGIIMSAHYLRSTPQPSHLGTFAAIGSHFDLLKLVMRADEPEEMSRLIEFFFTIKDRGGAISVASVGRYAYEMRLFFAREGSALNYTHLGTPLAEGQWSFTALRRALQRPRSV